ncbi:uncharacterized protein LOC141651573 [Silene latifolia]|uniref:uncharacterized protein LOC141651573 n=1 Tax=Silene latifolia TaxID=37657 RepID=UPI003D78942A
MATPSSSQVTTGIPLTADARKTREVSELVGIPVIPLGTIVDDEVVSQHEDEEVQSQHSKEDQTEWTEVRGKKNKTPPNSPITSGSTNLLQLTMEDIEPELQFWDTAVVCYVLGGNPPWELMEGFVRKLWSAYKIDKISFLPNGVFLVRFMTKECQSLVLQQGFPMFDNKPLVVKQWPKTCSLHKERVKFVPIWLRMCGLPLKFWSKSSLSKLVGLVGKLVKRDAATEDKTRLGYARLLVEVEIGQSFPDKLVFLDEKGQEVSILVEYEWKPSVCGACRVIGHTSDMCKKKQSAPVSKLAPKVQQVWRPIQKATVVTRTTSTEIPSSGPTYHNSSLITHVTVIQQLSRQEHVVPGPVSPVKSYVEALNTSPTSVGQEEGRLEEPPVETKIKDQDFSRVLNNLGHHWKDINNNDFHPGGRVWLIWDDQNFRVSLLHKNAQVISARITEVGTGETFLFSVVYGSNDEDERKELWDHLKFIHDTYQGPWGICGDFNNVLHSNERIGRDVRLSDVVHFKDCVDYCGLVDIKGKGAFFTWNNKQDPSVRGFSRIDRFMVNADWMALYPDAYAHFLPEGLLIIILVYALEKSPGLGGKPHSDITTCGLKKLKSLLKALNRGGFSDVEKSVAVAKALLEDIQIQMHQNPSDLNILAAESEAADSYSQKGALVTEEHAQILLTAATADEIKECLFSISSTKSHGPDGYSSQFFKDSWEIVGRMSLKLFRTASTQVLDKVICKRLAKVLPDVVSPNQGGFIKGKNIVENVLICQDLVRMYNRKVASPGCLIKIDLKKAYDSIEWSFLLQILHALKFPQKFIDLVMILGVITQQDDYRFHLMCGHIRLNHLLFADDLLLFCKGDAASIMWTLRAFSTFSAASGLSMNKTKSEIYFNGVTDDIMKSIIQISGFQRGTLPFKYLGVPIFSKKLTKIDEEKLIDRIVARIRGWGTRHLSYAGRVVLVNSVLSTLHSYWASMFLLSSRLMNRINALCRNFLWSGTSEYKRVPNVRWVNHVYMKNVAWTDYMAPADCNWSWKKITHIMNIFKQAYVGHKWLDKDIQYNVVEGYDWLREAQAKVPWRFLCWNSLNIPKCSFICWEFMHERLPTRDRLFRMNLLTDALCPVCQLHTESHSHLLYECDYAKACVSLLQHQLQISFRLNDLVTWYSSERVTKLQRKYVGSCHVSLLYWLWRVRNEAWKEQVVRTPKMIVKHILAEVKARFLKMTDSALLGRD